MNSYSKVKIVKTINRIFYHCGLQQDNSRAMSYAEDIYEKCMINDDIAIGLKNHVIKSFNGFGYPPISLFLDGLNYRSKSDSYLDFAKKSFKDLMVIFPYMKKTSSYFSKDTIMLTVLKELGGVEILTMKYITVDEMHQPTVNNWGYSQFEKEFCIEYVKVAQGYASGKLELEKSLIGQGAVKKRIDISFNIKELASLIKLNDKTALDSKKTPLLRVEFNKNVDNIAKGIIGG